MPTDPTAMPEGPDGAFGNESSMYDGNSSSYGNQMASEEIAQCRQVWFATVQVDALERLLMGSFAPALSFLTLFINSCAIAVLLHKSFRLSPSHVILLSIFAVDMATAGVPLPFCIYFYSLEYFKSYLPFAACYLRQLIMRLMPTISNTASIWLFTYLALQRYLIVCKRMSRTSSKLRVWLLSVAQTKTNTCIIAILLMAFVTHSIQLVDRYPVKINCSTAIWPSPTPLSQYEDADYVDTEQGSDYAPTDYSPLFNEASLQTMPTEETATEVSTCWLGSRFNENLPRHVATAIYATYYIFRAIFIHLLPCCLVTFATCSLIAEIRAANIRRKSLLLKPMSGVIASATAAVVVAGEKNTGYKSLLGNGAPNNQTEGQKKENTNGSSVLPSAGDSYDQQEANREQDGGAQSPNAHFSVSTHDEVKSDPNTCQEAAIDRPSSPNSKHTIISSPSSGSASALAPAAAHRPALKKQGSLMVGVCKPLLNNNTIVGEDNTRGSSGFPTARHGGNTTAANREKEYSVTSMLIVIMSIFLSVQLPQAVVFVWGILSGLGLVVTSEEAAYGFDLTLKILNILYLFTFPVQSSICFIMNRPFRQAFWRMIGLMPTPTNSSENQR